MCLKTLLLCLSSAALVASAAIDAGDENFDDTQLLRKPQADGRIIGGAPAIIVAFPYQLSLRYNDRHLCGASILSERFAITAAHCLDSDIPIARLTLRAGSASLYVGGTIHPITAVKIHPQFDAFEQDYDVAIIEVTKHFIVSARAAPIALPGSGVNPSVGTSAVVTGWGVTKEGKHGPSINLLYVTVPIVDSSECSRNYNGYGQITSRMICAGYEEGQRDACQGDSGGPLVADGTLIGVVSWGAGCARPNLPGVYTNLAEPSLRAWISKHTDGL